MNRVVILSERSESKDLSFRDLVFSIVAKIPKGQTMTYKEVAEAVGRPGAFRAAGNVLSTNFDPDIPCHRVVRSDGKAGGYNRGPERKMRILELEKEQRL